jgi:hypothetical protein
LKDRLESGYWTYLGFPAIVLLLSAFISSWSGVGEAFDWHKALPQGMARGQIGSWMLVPLAALGAFYDVYGAGAFFMSVSFGILLGLVTSGAA